MVKIGRTHLMDAVPIRLGQEFSGYARQIELAIERIEATLPGLRELAIGGTAVGTGLNTHPEFGARMARELSDLTGTSSGRRRTTSRRRAPVTPTSSPPARSRRWRGADEDRQRHPIARLGTTGRAG